MTAHSAHELAETVYCKFPNCTSEATVQAGRWARTCDEHRKVLVDQAREAGTLSGNTRGKPRRAEEAAPRKSAPESFAERAAALVAAGKKLDAARAKLEKAEGGLEPLRREVARAALEWRTLCSELKGSNATED